MQFTLTMEVILKCRQKEHQRLEEPRAFDLFFITYTMCEDFLNKSAV